MKQSPWKVSPAFDLIWLLPGLYILPLVGFMVSLKWIQEMRFAYVLINLTLSPAHLLAPMVALLVSRQIRNHVQSVNPSWRTHSLVIIVFNVTLMAATLTLIFQQGWSPPVILLFGIVGILWHIWNTLHFAMQQFGMMRLYRSLSNFHSPGARTFDFWVSMTLYGILHPIIWTHYGLRTKMIKDMGITLEVPPGLFNSLPYVWGVLLTLHLVRSFRYKELSLPFQATTLSSFALTGLIYHHPLAFTLLAASAIHWIQEIGLVYDRIGNHLPQKLPIPRAINIVGIIAVVLGCLILLSFKLLPLSFKIQPVLGVSQFKSFSAELAILPIVIFFLFNALAFLHFYLDRFIHKKTAAI